MFSLKSVTVTIVVLFLAIKFYFPSTKKQPKITIVGAGLSGLSAAVKLIENGFDNLVILEAEDRIGGRIHSVKLNHLGYVDLGGQWVHGQGNNSVYELANEKHDFGMTGFDDHFPFFIQSDGAALDQNKCQELATSAMKILFSSYEEMSKHPESVEDFFVAKFKQEAADKKEDEALVSEFIDFYEKEMNIWNGSTTWKDLSASLHCSAGYNSGIQHLTWKRAGFKKFLKILTKKYDLSDKIKLNKEVSNIKWNPKQEDKSPIITTVDGHTYITDHVIFTASLGVLKDRHHILFYPHLPDLLITAIKAMGYGNIGKVFLEFENPFWPLTDPNWVAYGLLWTESDKNEIKGTRREWLLDIQLFAKLDSFPNVLEALLAGPNMKTFETLSDEQITYDCMWLLEKFLKKHLKWPINMKRTKWLTNRNFLGSYSYSSMAAQKAGITSKTLSHTLKNSVMKPEVLFAGEHTDEFYPSNAHGAVRSGFKAADEIIDYYVHL